MLNIQFKIITPEKIVFEKEVISATIPTEEGEITVLPKHIPLISILCAGELKIQTSQKEEIYLAVSGGLIEVKKNQITILADTAELAEDIDEQKAKEAHERAKKLMQEAKNKEEVDYTSLAAKINKELARLKVARKSKHHFGPKIQS